MIDQSPEDTVDRLLAMRKMEASYSLQSFLQQQRQQFKLAPLSSTWRSKVVQWAFNVADHFCLSREVVSVSMSIFDRYLATQGNLCSGNMVLLTSLTTLHLAIKLHETNRIKSSVLANLSRGQFDVKSIDAMEMSILAALSWKLHAPTPLAYINEFLAFLPNEVTPAERKEVYELCKYMTELAVCESTFVTTQKSVVALAAIRNVMESMKFCRWSKESRSGFLRTISEIMGQAYESKTLIATRERLRSMFAKVSAAECYDGAYSAQTQFHPVSGGRVVSPNGSPSSTATSYEILGAGGNRGADYTTRASCYSRYRETTTRTNFWYTPSPPHRGKLAQVS